MDSHEADIVAQYLAGSLDLATAAERIAALEGFGDGIRDAGFDSAVVMGMGGSSLAPDVLRRTFGSAEGYPELRILDSTDPAAVAATLDDGAQERRHGDATLRVDRIQGTALKQML